MKKLKNIDYKILFELIKNSKISDRKLAKKVGVSQPTVTRRRARLEKEGMIDYTAIPNFEKLGFEIMAFSFASWTNEAQAHLETNEYNEKVHTFAANLPEVIFTSSGRGLGMGIVVVSVHKDYSNYVKFITKLRQEWGNYLSQFDSFNVSLKSDIVTPFTFKHLLENMKTRLK